MKLSLLFVSLLSAFALAHGPDDDGDEMPKAVAPKATAAPKAATPPKAIPSGFSLPKGAPPKASAPPKAAAPPKGMGMGHSHGGM